MSETNYINGKVQYVIRMTPESLQVTGMSVYIKVVRILGHPIEHSAIVVRLDTIKIISNPVIVNCVRLALNKKVMVKLSALNVTQVDLPTVGVTTVEIAPLTGIKVSLAVTTVSHVNKNNTRSLKCQQLVRIVHPLAIVVPVGETLSTAANHARLALIEMHRPTTVQNVQMEKYHVEYTV